MPFDEQLGARVRALLSDAPGFSERRMFGGIGYMLHGNMACGVTGADLLVRVGPAAYAEALARPEARVFDMTGRPMTGWVVVAAAAVSSDGDLRRWVAQGQDFALSLPAK